VASVAISQMDGLGPAAGKMGNTLTSLISTGFTPMGLAIVAVTAAVGFMISKFAESEEAAKKLEESQIKAVEAARKMSESIREIGEANRITNSADPALEAINQKYKKQIDLLLEAKAGTGAYMAAIEAEANEIRKITGVKITEQNAIYAQITAVRDEKAALFATADAQIKLSTEQKANTILTSAQAREHAGLAAALAKQTTELGNLQRAQSQIRTGQDAASSLEGKLGVQLPITIKLDAQKTTTELAALVNAMRDDDNPEAVAGFNQMFGAWVKMGIEKGWPDLPELLAKSAIPQDVRDRLVASLAPDLKAGFDASFQYGEQWGQAMVKATTDAITGFAAAGAELDKYAAKQNELIAAVAQKLALSLDTSPAEQGLSRVQVQLEIMKAQILNMPKVAVVQ